MGSGERSEKSCTFGRQTQYPQNRPQVVEHWLKGEINRHIAVEFHLSGLIGTASQTDMQKIRKIGFFFENM
jgi:hypothetical protein